MTMRNSLFSRANPRQPDLTPAADALAMPRGIAVAFKAFKDIEAMRVALLGRG